MTAVQNNPEVLDNEYDDTQDDLPAADMSYDTPGVADSLLIDCDSVHHSTVMVSDNDLDPTGRYDLRPRHRPRITSGWSDKRWTNSYHTDKLDLK